MGFDICFKWREKAADAVTRNEELARSLLAKFPSLSRFALDFDAIAKSIGVPREKVLSHWCQVELDDDGNELGSAIITFWPESVIVQVPSRPSLGIQATLERLAPLFDALREAGLETDPEFDISAEYEMQKAYTERVARIVGKDR